MLRGPLLRRCSAAAAQTLSSWLTRLAEAAEALPRPAATPHNGAAETMPATTLWREVEDAATHSNALRETDTLLGVMQCLLRKRHYPPDVHAWTRLSQRLLPYSGIETASVLHYPGEPHAAAHRSSSSSSIDEDRSSSSGSGATPLDDVEDRQVVPYQLRATRETLLMSGGVVPLSSRVPCGDGRAIAVFLRGFTDYVVEQLMAHTAAGESLETELLSVVAAVSEAVLSAVATNAATVQLELLLPALLDYMHLLHELDLHAAASTPTAPQHLHPFASDLAQRALVAGARGARAVLLYLDTYFAETLEAHRASATGRGATEEFYWEQQASLLSLTRVCMETIHRRYALPSSEGGVPALDLAAATPLAARVQSLYDRIDALFQQNTNAGNPLGLDGDASTAQLKEVHTAALLRALRLEVHAPDAYLRRALEVVDRVPSSMAIEGELISGKVRLLELDSDALDGEGRAAIYADLLTSLRSLVEMRPRVVGSSTTGGAATLVGDGDGDGGGDDEEADAEQTRVDAATQSILQRAHADVLTAFCAAHTEEWSSEAYGILVAHKYHGVKVTNALMRPVLEAFSRRGDCRVFSLVDLCVLYCGEPIDMHTIGLLLRTCASAGDHYRARTFLQLLNEIIPGFLVKRPASVTESLQELRLVDRPPPHLFVTTEDDLVQRALGQEERAVRRLPTAPPA
ncbi:hypothetical protein NESM_000206100 [Novymonas esmeraldas]|uniref:Uncharacterized protein n=1 Tax=Novymonas esmeraldas TaxID=1808958 RepID=A0AAW0F8V0_9TRYP